MNKEAMTLELNGQIARLVEMYGNKAQLEIEIEKKTEELKNLAGSIKEIVAIIQTLQVILNTDGFVNLDKLPQRQVDNPHVVNNPTNIKDLQKLMDKSK
jgi:hypothetical protein